MFHLKKHYFDGVDSNGNLFILYYAELKLFGIKIPYSSYIISNELGIKEKSILKKSTISSSNASFANTVLGIDGNWNATEQMPEEILWQEKKNRIKWNCTIPKGRFQIQSDNKTYSGLGYTEILDLNFAPWKMPISTLKWGRFLSENHSVIWIEWIGKVPLKKVYWNGKLLPSKSP